MKQKFFRKNLLVLLSLFVIGFMVHFKSFQMVPYGDDWKHIYNYFTHEEIGSNFSSLPGIFSYLAPYGPSTFTIGLLYQVFGKMYFVYYLFPLIFKILTAFFVFITLRNISYALKKNNDFTNFLSAILFLVGITGIQAIDWSMNMNVYIGLSIFVLSLFFQIRFYIFSGKLNLILGLFLSLFSIITIPIRLYSLIFIVPLIDSIMIIKNGQVLPFVNKDKTILTTIVLKNIIFGVFIFVFWLIGVFGIGAASIYSPYPSPIARFINEVSTEPFLSFKTFLHWIGVTILPTYPASNILWTSIVGAVFLIVLFIIFYKYRSRYIVIGSILFFIPLTLMWGITPLRIIDSADRYLPPAFLGLCLLVGIVSMFTDKYKNILKIILILIILIQVSGVHRIYSYWISIGRGSDFIIPVQEKIMSHFPTPINSPRIIYLDFDDAAPLQSVVFGLAYRVAILSGTRNISYLPRLFSDKTALIKAIKEDIGMGKQGEKIIDSISAFQLRNKVFTDISPSLQDELREEFKNPD